MRSSIIRLLALALVQPASPALAQTEPTSVTIVTLHAQGAQVYQCQSDSSGRLSWQFREPVATLLDAGKTVGRHFAGPTWELSDGTLLTAKVVARSPGATDRDIPWLRLHVDHAKGGGAASQSTIIRRHNTQGGSLSGACSDAGRFMSVGYSADYTFIKEHAQQ